MVKPQELRGGDSVVWTRAFSHHSRTCDCDALTAVLGRIGGSRMVSHEFHGFIALNGLFFLWLFFLARRSDLIARFVFLQIMGHTIHDHINSVCGGRAIRIDVGMSKGFAEH
jgi:hypothetical protein